VPARARLDHVPLRIPGVDLGLDLGHFWGGSVDDLDPRLLLEGIEVRLAECLLVGAAPGADHDLLAGGARVTQDERARRGRHPSARPPRRGSAAVKPAECPSWPPDNVVVGSIMPLRPFHREDSPFIRSLPTATIAPVWRR